MNSTTEMQNGKLSFKNSNIYITLDDNTECLITEEHYVEIFQQYNSECSTCIALNQQYADGLWYFDIIDYTWKDKISARFRIAKEGERKKNGTIRITKNKLYIDLWDESSLQIENNATIELNLPDHNSVMRWQKVRVNYSDANKKWCYNDIFESEHSLQDKHKNSYGVLEYNQLARITY